MSDDNVTPFPTADRQADRFVRAFRSGLAGGMAGAGLDAERIRRALDKLEPNLRLLGESLAVDPLPPTVWEYQQAVIAKAADVLGERLRAILEEL